MWRWGREPSRAIALLPRYGLHGPEAGLSERFPVNPVPVHVTTIAIHQPQYLPWLPYFQKIAGADVFVYLDNVQFQKGGLQNRNRIKGPDGPQWLTVPVNASLDHHISNVRIANRHWQAKHGRSVMQCYAKSENVKLYGELIEPALSAGHEYLVDLNMDLVQRFMTFLGIGTTTVRASSLGARGTKGDLVIEICKELEGTRYLSGSGARDYQSEAQFEERGIHLEYHVPRVREHAQCHMRNGFEQGMSIVDAILNLGEGARELI